MKIKWSAVAVASLALLSASSSNAADIKTSPGNMCQSNSNNDTYTTTSNIKNTSGANILINCGLTRDNTTNVNGLLNLEVTVLDNTGTMNCSAESLTRFGSSVKSVSKVTPGVGAQIIDFNADLNLSVASGIHRVVCLVPNNARIDSLLWDEP